MQLSSPWQACDPWRITSWHIGGEKVEVVTDFSFLGSKITAMVTAAMKLKDACSLGGKLWQTRQYIKNQKHHFANKGHYSQNYGSSSSHGWMWEMYHKEAVHQNIDAFELRCWKRLLRVPLDCKEIKLVNP